ncbi:unnamed protein product, partial [Larinioides sclopetarius]
MPEKSLAIEAIKGLRMHSEKCNNSSNGTNFKAQ